LNHQSIKRFVFPTLLVVMGLLALVILAGLASQNPDGFEWAVFDFAAIMEPEGGFAGIWAFLGEGPLVDLLTGTVGVLVVLGLACLLFWVASRKSK
jgi:hypothetical protein